jgi:hypothetical protein
LGQPGEPRTLRRPWGPVVKGSSRLCSPCSDPALGPESLRTNRTPYDAKGSHLKGSGWYLQTVRELVVSPIYGGDLLLFGLAFTIRKLRNGIPFAFRTCERTLPLFKRALCEQVNYPLQKDQLALGFLKESGRWRFTLQSSKGPWGERWKGWDRTSHRP